MGSMLNRLLHAYHLTRWTIIERTTARGIGGTSQSIQGMFGVLTENVMTIFIGVPANDTAEPRMTEQRHRRSLPHRLLDAQHALKDVNGATGSRGPHAIRRFCGQVCVRLATAAPWKAVDIR